MSLEVKIIPGYAVDFSQFLPSEPEEQAERVSNTGISIIKYIQIVLSSTYEAGRLTFGRSVQMIRYTALDLLRTLPFPVTLFKIPCWSVRLGYEFLATTVRLTGDKLIPPSHDLHYLREFIDDGIDIRHLRSNTQLLDVSKVPSEIQVSQLAELLAAVNFSDEGAPGYMPPSSRRETSLRRDRSIEYTVPQLKESLATLIHHVNNRTPFLGTPPAYARDKLARFYQQIEDAIRLSIHAVTSEMEAFLEEHGRDPSSYVGEAVRKKHRDLLENQARLAIDMAIAGVHCGARYMGEAWVSYANFCGEQAIAGETLQEALIERLAIKRQEIAVSEAQRIFGSNPHKFSKYIENIGAIVGIPGAENTIEHIDSSRVDRKAYLRRFFDTYTEDLIIDTVQKEIKKSQKLREFIVDWFQEQDLTKWEVIDPVISAEELEEQLKEIKDSVVSIDELSRAISLFQRMLKAKSRKQLTDTDSWADFVEDTFAEGSSKQLFIDEFRECKGNFIERIQKKEEIKLLLKEGVVARALEERYRETGNSEIDDTLRDLLQKMAKVDEMKKFLPVDNSVLLRILNGDTELSTVIEGYRAQQKGAAFLHALNIGNMEENGLPPVLLEWLLYAHQILTPKSLDIEPLPEERIRHQGKAFGYALLVSHMGYYRNFSRNRVGIRSRIEEDGKKELRRWQVFNKAFTQRRQEVERLAREITDISPSAWSNKYSFADALMFIGQVVEMGIIISLELGIIVGLIALLEIFSYLNIAPIIGAYYGAVAFFVGIPSLVLLSLFIALDQYPENRMARNILNQIEPITNYLLVDGVAACIIGFFIWMMDSLEAVHRVFENKAAVMRKKEVNLLKKKCYALFKRGLQCIGDQPIRGDEPLTLRWIRDNLV